MKQISACDRMEGFARGEEFALGLGNERAIRRWIMDIAEIRRRRSRRRRRAENRESHRSNIDVRIENGRNVPCLTKMVRSG